MDMGAWQQQQVPLLEAPQQPFAQGLSLDAGALQQLMMMQGGASMLGLEGALGFKQEEYSQQQDESPDTQEDDEGGGSSKRGRSGVRRGSSAGGDISTGPWTAEVRVRAVSGTLGTLGLLAGVSHARMHCAAEILPASACVILPTHCGGSCSHAHIIRACRRMTT